MKITRRQLRKLIQEITIKPGGDLYDYDPEGKIEVLATSDDEMNRNMADDMADTFGYEGSYSSDLDHYYNEPRKIAFKGYLDDLEFEVGPDDNRFMRKLLHVDEITNLVAEYFDSVVAKEPNHAFQEMMEKGYSFEDIVENIKDYMLPMIDIPDEVFDNPYFDSEIEERFSQGLRNVLEYEY
jgi:hypothetical protein